MRVIPVALLFFMVLSIVTFTILPPYMREDSQNDLALLRPLGTMTIMLGMLLLFITMGAPRFDKACAWVFVGFGSFLVMLAITDGHQGLFLALPNLMNTFLHTLLAVVPVVIALAMTNPHPTKHHA